MWILTTPIWIAIAFIYSITETGKQWIAPTAFIVLFLVPELVSIRRRNDRLPPLTHMIRGYIDDDLAFPCIYFLVGALGGRWFGFPISRFLGLGFIAAMLGWLTIHFTLSYLGPDPRRGADPLAAEARTERSRQHLEL